MIKLQTFSYFILLAILSPSIAANFDGKYIPEITSTDADPACSGFVNEEGIIVKNGKLTGSISHTEAGHMEVSGSVNSDGKIIDGAFSGNTLDGTVQGSLKTKKGTWSESYSNCEGTMRFIGGPTVVKDVGPLAPPKFPAMGNRPVKIENKAVQSNAPVSSSTASAFSRLRKLKSLFDAGLITSEEYKDKKAEILKSL